MSEMAAVGRDGFSRIDVDAGRWMELGHGLADGKHTLLALWADGNRVRMALSGEIPVIATLTCSDGHYPSVGQFHPPAIRLERALRDLGDLTPQGLPDSRAWLDHGVWPDRSRAERAYPFLSVEGDGLHQIPVGPVHAGIIEPGHFRFTANGETVVRLEERLGYVHKGIEALAVGRTVDQAARLMARVSGDSTVAYSFAFARAVELATGVTVPERATLLRGIAAELERIAHHVNDFGAICNDASAVALHAHCTLLRERILAACDAAFGHRLLMDVVVPGGVAVDVSAASVDQLRRLLDHCERDFDVAVRKYDGSPSIQDRTVTTGHVSRMLVEQFGAGGHVGRASGRRFDCRRNLAYPPYDTLTFDVPVREDGDVNARAWIRINEVTQSVAVLRQLFDRLEPGPVRTEWPALRAGEGAALTEAFRGDVLIAVRLDDDGTIARCHARDASVFQWPLLEAAIEGNIVADFPLCNKSFNCSYSGHDM
jgi:Ni,Fe-hydrogenase III large subunit